MSSDYRSVPLRSLLSRSVRSLPIDPATEYQQIRLKLHHRGAVIRRIASGHELQSSRQYIAAQGQLIISRIDARNGAIAIVPPELDGALVTNDFWLFDISHELVAPQYLDEIVGSEWFVAKCRQASEGTTNRVRLQIEPFLSMEISLPSLQTQRTAVAQIQRTTNMIGSAMRAQTSAEKMTRLFLGSVLGDMFGDPSCGSQTTNFGDWTTLGDAVLDVADGPHVTPAYVEQGVPFITVLNIVSGTVDFTGAKFISEAAHRAYQRRARAERGDVQITKDGTIGVPCLVDTDREFSFFVSVALVKPDRRHLDGAYLTWALRAPYMQRWIQAKARGDMIRHLVLREIRSLALPLPSLTRQREIVASLERLKSTIQVIGARQGRTSSELRALETSIRAEALGVRGAAS